MGEPDNPPTWDEAVAVWGLVAIGTLEALWPGLAAIGAVWYLQRRARRAR